MRVRLDGGGMESKIDITTLPVTHTNKIPACAGIFSMIFGLIFAGGPGLFFITSILSGEFELEMLFILIFVFAGISMFLGGIYSLTYKSTIHITPNQISVDSSSIFGRNSWTESLNKYRGIISRSEYRSGGKNRSSYTLYIIEMYHHDPAKRIKLYESRSSYNIRAIWEDYCKKLNMKAIEGEGDDIVEREAADLDKSVRELAAEGKLDVKFDPTRRPPDGIRVSSRGEVLIIELPKIPSSIIGTIFGLVFSGFFVALRFFVHDVPFIFPLMGLFFFAIVLASSVMSRISNTAIAVDKNEVTTWQNTPWGEWRKRSIGIDQLETVRVGREQDRSMYDSLLLISDEKTIKIAEGMSKSSLEWLKNCILAATTQ